MTRFLAKAALGVAVPALLFTGVACSSSDSQQSAPTSSDSGSPARVLTATSAATAETQAPKVTAASMNSATTTGAPTNVAEVATDNKFSATSIRAAAGQPITIDVTNKGQAVHDWSLQNFKDASGKAARTELLERGKSQSITFSVSKPGTYYFQCTVHPTEMKGTLIVS